jgi:transcriptional regulator with XRE-family HTH domain
MDSKAEIRDLLVSRRAKITPQQAGLPAYGKRRVPGLRREEVAALAGVSVDYYNRLERGNLAGVSDSVLEAVAAALQLDDAERIHLYDLARAANPTPRTRRAPRRPRMSPSIARVLNGMTDVAAIVTNGRLDLLAANRLGRALYSPAYEEGGDQPNLARFAFLDRRAHDLYPDWEGAANVAVALLRIEAGRNPHDRALSDLVGELSTRSEDFRVRWAAHIVRLHESGTKVYRHPAVGPLTLSYDRWALPGEGGLFMTAYSAEPGSPSQDALKLLASWAATLDDQHETNDTTPHSHQS